MKIVKNRQLFIISCVIFYVSLSGIIITIHGIVSGGVLGAVFGISSIGFIYGLIKLRRGIREHDGGSGGSSR
jgi:hypothetical protein